MRQRLYETAINLITERGYASTTLRDVAAAAGVSVGLLYKYFASKRAIVLELYDQLSTDYAARAAEMPSGKWHIRFLFALQTSLDVLHPHRETLASLVPVLVGSPEEGLFASNTAFSRVRVETVFQNAVVEAKDSPWAGLAVPLGRLLYLLHLAVILWWLLDKSPRQRATKGLLALLRRVLPAAALVLRVPPVPLFVRSIDALLRDALFQEPGRRLHYP